MNAPWRTKAHRLIAALCLEAWRQANTSKAGRRYKRHHPYTVPTTAQDLIACLDADDEERAKAIFLGLLP